MVSDVVPAKEASTPAAKEDNLFQIELPTNDNSPKLLSIRHSTAHVMAMAVQKLFSDAKVTIGPWIENGYISSLFHR